MLHCMKRDLGRHVRLAVAALVLLTGCGSSDNDDPPILERMLAEQFVPETSRLVTLQTFRTDDPQSEQRAVDNLASARDYLNGLAETFNRGQRTLKLEPFEWRGAAGTTPTQWVFGFRLGDGPKKIAILAHLDTVPGNADWRPFEPRIETRDHRGSPQSFLVGRPWTTRARPSSGSS